jgi:hypothetical protein
MARCAWAEIPRKGRIEIEQDATVMHKAQLTLNNREGNEGHKERTAEISFVTFVIFVVQ